MQECRTIEDRLQKVVLHFSFVLEPKSLKANSIISASPAANIASVVMSDHEIWSLHRKPDGNGEIENGNENTVLNGIIRDIETLK